MHVLTHPERYKTGARLLVLRARNKDGATSTRTLQRASFTPAEFDQQLDELAGQLRPGERIYASAGARDMHKAIRLFKERELAAGYDADPEAFYRSIERRWFSCLMDTLAQAEKIWLFDCDDDASTHCVRQELAALAWPGEPPYEYSTKSGMHFVVPAFDKTQLTSQTRALIHDNALMLWGFST